MKQKFEKENYSKSLREPNLLTKEYIFQIVKVLENRGLKIKEITPDKVRKLGRSENLSRLPIFIVKGGKSWQGMAVGFPGNTEGLTTSNVGTPFLRILLYPMLELFQDINEKHLDNGAKCLYMFGVRFPDVFVRKFNLLRLLTPNLIIVTNDVLKTIRNSPYDIDRHCGGEAHESRYQHEICKVMDSDKGLPVLTSTGQIAIKYISHEVQTGEGTVKPERLDILGVDTNDKSLVVFEIKGPSCGDEQFKNLFFQGLEHLVWIEKNKMAIKLIKEGPKGNMINTKKRARLILGFQGEKVPPIFYSLRNVLQSKDKYMRIDFVKLALDNKGITLTSIK